MAHVANTAKVFNFAIEINGLNQFLAQTVEFPEITQEVVKHGDTNYSVGTPGRLETADLVIEKLVAAPGADRWAWDWFNAGADPFVGGGALAGNVKRIVIVRELDASGLGVLRSWLFEGCFIKGFNLSKFDRMSSDNIIETITLNVDRVKLI